MARLIVPDETQKIEGFVEIRDFLKTHGILHDRWPLVPSANGAACQQDVLEAYADSLTPFMEVGGYATADVISLGPETKGLAELRTKFLAEHTHTEDEVRFFIEGKGMFWFNPVDGPVFALLCHAGDLISVPAGVRHWFDLGVHPKLKAIRVFTDPSGWVAHYTGSAVEERYQVLSEFWK